MSSQPTRHAWVIERLRSRMRAQGSGSDRGGVESTEAANQPPPLNLTDEGITDHVHSLGQGLREYAARCLGNDAATLALVAQLEDELSRGLTLFGNDNVEGLARDEGALMGLEAIVVADGTRPSYLICKDQVRTDSSWCVNKDWASFLEQCQAELSKAIQCVGRIDLGGSDPQGPSQGLGTGFLVQRDLAITNRHVLQQLPQWRGQRWEPTPHTRAWLDFGQEHEGQERVRRREVIGIAYTGIDPIDPRQIDHHKLDLALLELAPPTADESPPCWLGIDSRGEDVRQCSEVLVVGYPIDPGRFRELDLLEKIFARQFGKKRLSPGSFVGGPDLDAATTRHDASTLAGNSGSVVLQMTDTRLAGALHYGGIPRQENWAHILGNCLERPGLRGRTLRQVLEEREVWLV